MTQAVAQPGLRGDGTDPGFELETMNRELAALLHAGLPAMVRKFCGRAKMEALFADKKDMIYTAIAQRLQQPDDKKGKK